MEKWTEYGIDFLANDTAPQAVMPDWLTLSAVAGAPKFHAAMPGYQPTPLLKLENLAKAGNVAGVYVKNEAPRFGLNAFKVLGSSYAISQTICQKLGLSLDEVGFAGLKRQNLQNMVFATATDGNHGRGVAWVSRELGCPAHIYMPAGTEPERAEAIRAFGAAVTVTDLCYDDTAALAKAQAEQNGWTLVQDTSFPGYVEIPKLIIQGYATIAAEIAKQLPPDEAPTHIFLQAGVGSMAGGMLACLAQYYPAAKFIILEPKNVACCLLAAEQQNDAASVPGVQQTIMAGLNCGTPCPLIMPLLREKAACFIGCPDYVAAHGMRLAARPTPGDEAYTAGESGAVGLGIAALLLSDRLAQSRAKLGIDEGSRLLSLNTEGSMAPSVWRQIVEHNACPLPEEVC